MKYIRDHLGAKFFLANLIVVLVGLVILATTIQLTIPSAYNRHMGMMDPSMMNSFLALGKGQGWGRLLLSTFRATMFESLASAVTASTLVALIASLFLSDRIVAPLRKLTDASQDIADGHYDKQVEVGGSDEIAQLATRFNRMAAQLEQVESLRRELIGDITHELRTPLTSIKGYMEGLVDGVIPASADTFNQIHHEADRLSHLVDDLQELSRVESKAYSLDFVPVAVSTLVQITMRRLAPQADARSIHLTTELPSDLPPIHVDQDRMIQVMDNLVANAIQYTLNGGKVIISAIRLADEIHISVTDTGIGIPPEHLALIFTRFYRVEKSRSRTAGGGSGIGLTIARHLVEAHGGRIWAESAGEGKGSKFTFSVNVSG